MITKKKHSVDLCMLMGLLALMSYQRIGEDVHEWIGILESILFVVHLFLNRHWIMHITKGTYTWFRIVQTCLFISISICFSMQIISGIILSKTLFQFLSIQGMTSLARQCHMIAAYWGFVFLSVHLGLHISTFTTRYKNISRYMYCFLYSTICLMSCYGIYAFFKRDIVSYMTQKIEFAYFDYEESLLIFFFDYLCVLVFIAIGIHYIIKAIRKYGR